jgi:outer membrane immunogenic protein
MNIPGRLSLFLTGLTMLALPSVASATPFTGFYVGGNAGIGFGGDTAVTDLDGFNYYRDNFFTGEVTKVGDDTLFTGGGQVGYNHAFDRLVVGIEADFSSFDFYARKTPATSAQDWGSDTYVALELSWLATVRGRLGLALDRWLLYGTGGIAFSDGEVRNHDFCNTVPPCGSGLIDAKGDIDTGWTVGGGAEFAWSPNWTVKAEYLFARFDGDDFSGTAYYPASTAFYRFSADHTDFNIVRAGLNYKFGRTVEVTESLK